MLQVKAAAALLRADLTRVCGGSGGRRRAACRDAGDGAHPAAGRDADRLRACASRMAAGVDDARRRPRTCLPDGARSSSAARRERARGWAARGRDRAAAWRARSGSPRRSRPGTRGGIASPQSRRARDPDRAARPSLRATSRCFRKARSARRASRRSRAAAALRRCRTSATRRAARSRSPPRSARRASSPRCWRAAAGARARARRLAGRRAGPRRSVHARRGKRERDGRSRRRAGDRRGAMARNLAAAEVGAIGEARRSSPAPRAIGRTADALHHPRRMPPLLAARRRGREAAASPAQFDRHRYGAVGPRPSASPAGFSAWCVSIRAAMAPRMRRRAIKHRRAGGDALAVLDAAGIEQARSPASRSAAWSRWSWRSRPGPRVRAGADLHLGGDGPRSWTSGSKRCATRARRDCGRCDGPLPVAAFRRQSRTSPRASSAASIAHGRCRLCGRRGRDPRHGLIGRLGDICRGRWSSAAIATSRRLLQAMASTSRPHTAPRWRTSPQRPPADRGARRARRGVAHSCLSPERGRRRTLPSSRPASSTGGACSAMPGSTGRSPAGPRSTPISRR